MRNSHPCWGGWWLEFGRGCDSEAAELPLSCPKQETAVGKTKHAQSATLIICNLIIIFQKRAREITPFKCSLQVLPSAWLCLAWCFKHVDGCQAKEGLLVQTPSKGIR